MKESRSLALNPGTAAVWTLNIRNTTPRTGATAPTVTGARRTPTTTTASPRATGRLICTAARTTKGKRITAVIHAGPQNHRC